jgi:hypothetical protein
MKRPWYAGWQWRDLPLVLFCAAIVLGSVYIAAALTAHVLVSVLRHVQHSLNHP